MENNQNTPPTVGDGGKDPKLWELAQKRASFKSHLATYVVMNAFFWILWYLNGRNGGHNGWPWPVWPMLGWGIGLVFHYIGAYISPKENLAEREYEKLKNKNR
jgi:hypothetical protein